MDCSKGRFYFVFVVQKILVKQVIVFGYCVIDIVAMEAQWTASLFSGRYFFDRLKIVCL